MYSNEMWAQLTPPGGAQYHPAWAPVLLLELLGNLAIVSLTLLVLYTFFARSRSFALVLIVQQSFTVAVLLVDEGLLYVLPAGEPSPPGELIGMVFGAGIVIAYALHSKRVRSTFLPPPDAAEDERGVPG